MTAIQQPTVAAEVRRFQTECGRVIATAPVAPDVYWRVEYQQDGERKQTTGGRTLASASRKAEAILRKLDGVTGPNSSVKVGVVLEKYIGYLEGSASPNHAEKTVPDLRKALATYRNLACSELASHQLRKSCDAAASKSVGDHRRSRLSAFLKWGYAEGYFSEQQTHLLKSYRWARPKGAPVRPTRDFTAVRQGETKRFVTEDQVPLHKDLVALGDALEERLPGKGKLMVEFAFAAGARSGELFALEDRAFDTEHQHVDIDWQVLALSAKQLAKYNRSSRRGRPKGGKIRTTNFPDVTPSGFRLLDALAERIEQVDWEHRNGRSPKRLVFPAPQGGWFWHTSFTSDHLHAAAEAADWEFIRWTEPDGRRRKLLRHPFHTLRHRFARDRIDLMGYRVSDLQVIGGWDSAQVVWERYYGSSSDALALADQKLLEWQGGGQELGLHT